MCLLRQTSEKRRLRHFLGLAIDLNTAETNVLQGAEARPVVATMEGLADQLATVGPEPLSVVDETRDQMFDLKAQESTLQDVLLGRNRDLEAQESQEEEQNRSLGGRAGASLEFQKSYLLRRIKVHHKFMVDLLGFMDKKEAVVGRAVLRLEAALATCDARDEVISAADERMAKHILELIDRAQNQEPAPAPVEPPAYSVTTALNKNNVDATFLATRALSPVDTWYVLSTCLGQGTFGGVFKIDVLTLGESFAMKLIKEGEGENARRRTRRSQESLLGEMVICVCVPPHPNVLQAVGVDDRELDCMKIVYHLAEGAFSCCAWGSTEDSAGTKMRYLSEAAMGLTHLANHGYVHNDIKPSNILLVDSTQDGNKTTRAVLADFGCALGAINALRQKVPRQHRRRPSVRQVHHHLLDELHDVKQEMAPSLAQVLSGEGGGDGGGPIVRGGGGSDGGNAMLPLSMQATGGDAAAVGRTGAGGSAATALPKYSAGGATAAAVAADGRAGVLPSSNNVPRDSPLIGGEVRAGEERVPRAIQVGSQHVPPTYDGHRGPGGRGFENLQPAGRVGGDGNAARVGACPQAPSRCHHPQRQGCAPRAATAPRHRRHNHHHQHRGGNEEAVVGIGVKPDGRRSAAAGGMGNTGRRPQHDAPRENMSSAFGGTGTVVPSPPCVRPPPGYEQYNTPGHAQHSAPGYAECNAPGYTQCSTTGYAQRSTPGYGQYSAPGYAQCNAPGYAQCSTLFAVPPLRRRRSGVQGDRWG
ncbi:myosin IIIA [Ectocarpus siliculosus]|uniref:Myosin IIIA n=1 Tax=Ectocarpus siliculosus TaxID=2880 RepID=D7FGW2_ECTSI|nr:myosin IIIA [Ectocarpus siliculosus]|eukprot:CBJ48951.1 myosin IIIA [Ectocarpus siliculosus]